MAKTVKEIKTFDERKEELLEKGKKEGFITFEDLASALKGLDIDSDALDELYNLFVENGIEVVSSENESSESGKQNKIVEEEVVVLNDEELTKDININDLARMLCTSYDITCKYLDEEDINLHLGTMTEIACRLGFEFSIKLVEKS